MIILAKKTITADYLIGQHDRVINADTTGGPITVTLPDHTGRGFKVIAPALTGPLGGSGNATINTINSSASQARTIAVLAGETIDDLFPKIQAVFPEVLWTQPGGAGTDVEGVYSEKAFIPVDAIYTPAGNIFGGVSFQIDHDSYGQDPILAYTEYDIVNTGTDVLTLAASGGDTLQGGTDIPVGESRKVVSFGDGGWYIVGGGAGGGATIVNIEERFNFNSDLDTVRTVFHYDTLTLGTIKFDNVQVATVGVEASLDGTTWTPFGNVTPSTDFPASVQTWIDANAAGVRWYMRFTATYVAAKIGIAGVEYRYTR